MEPRLEKRQIEEEIARLRGETSDLGLSPERGRIRLPEPGRTVPSARVIRLEKNLLVVEFEVPESGIVLPAAGDAVTVRFRTGQEVEANVDGSLSTRPGSHPGGLTLRLGLRLPEGFQWLSGRAVLEWSGGGGVFCLEVEVS